MTIANRLVSQGWSRAAAMIRAWAVVKLLPRLETKVAGVTYGNRQQALEHLTRYSPEAVSIRLEREADNTHDRNAIAVYAVVEGKGAYCVGYLPRALAAFIAPLLDAGKAVGAMFREVRGGYKPWMNLGMVVEVIA
jgi:ADP-ribosylglycohydrolase